MVAADAVSTRDAANIIWEEVFVSRMVVADAVSTRDVRKVIKEEVFV